MRFQFPNLLFLVLIESAYGNVAFIDLDCTFEYEILATVGRQYTCFVQNDLNILEPNVSISSDVLGTHVIDQTIDSVTALWIENKNTEYLPNNIGEIFVNLVALRVKNGRIKELNKDDLKSMPKLKYLNLDDNDIAILDDDVFEYNTKLELVWLSANKIKKIGEKLADNFKSLVSLDLTKNVCTNKRFSLLDTTFVNVSSRLVLNKFDTLTKIMQTCANFTDTIIEIPVKAEVKDHPEFKIYKEQIKHLNNQLSSTRSELKSIKLKLGEEISAKNKTLKMLNELQTSESRSNNEVDNGNIAELEIKLMKEEKEVRNLKDELKKFRSIHNEFHNLKVLVKKNEEEKFNLNKQLEKDQAEMRKLQAENAELRNKNKELQSQVSSVTKIDTGNRFDDSTSTNTEADWELIINSATTDAPNIRIYPVESEENEIYEEVTIYDYYN